MLRNLVRAALFCGALAAGMAGAETPGASLAAETSKQAAVAPAAAAVRPTADPVVVPPQLPAADQAAAASDPAMPVVTINQSDAPKAASYAVDPILNAGPKGSLVIIGGALRTDNSAVWERIVRLAGGESARIAVFASASASPEATAKYNIELLNQYGADAFFVPVAVKLAGRDYKAAADDPEVAAAVRKAGGAYFAGGDQARITQALRRPDGSNTLVLDALWDMYRNGGVIAGSSAGAAIMSSTMFDEPRSVLATLKRGVAEGQEISAGLGFIGDDVFV